MCGFLISLNVPINQRIFKNALEKINHRGPDEQNTYYDKKLNLYLGHNRLSIIDLLNGKQPFWSPDNKKVILYNGEIYNFKIIKKQLSDKGHKFYSQSDTEVILKFYEEYGTDSFEFFNGMFAFVIIDFEKKLIICSRDYYGKKPLYYFQKNNEIIISSEIEPITYLKKNELTLSQDNFKYFAFNGYYSKEKTYFDEVFKFQKNSVYEINFLKDLKFKLKFIYNPEINQKKSIRETLIDSVGIRMNADKNIGSFLSGGIDSTLVTLIAKKINPDINTYSIIYEDTKYDESKQINEIVSLYNLKNNSLILNQECLKSNINDIFDISEPICDSSIIPTYILSKFAKEKSDVILSGDGADELFFGYNVYNALAMSYFLDNFGFNFVLKKISKMNNFNEGNSYFNKLFIIKKFLNGYMNNNELRLSSYLSQLYHYQFNKLFKTDPDLTENKNYEFSSFDKYMNFFKEDFINNYLLNNILTKCDLASMKASIELRSPFLDINFRNIDIKPSKYRFNIKKKIFAENFSDYLDIKFFFKKKHGFAIPNNLIFDKENIDYFYSIKDRFDIDHNYLKSLFELNRLGKINLKNFFWGYIHLNKIIDKYSKI